MLVEKFKSSAIYKLLKSTEAVAMVVLPLLFVFLGFFQLIPALIISGSYLLVNLTGFATKALWETRDAVMDETEKRLEDVKRLKK
jgi:hypothetical protein